MYFHKKTAPQLLGHIGLQNMKVGEKTNFGRLATIFQIFSMDADILLRGNCVHIGRGKVLR